MIYTPPYFPFPPFMLLFLLSKFPTMAVKHQTPLLPPSGTSFSISLPVHFSVDALLQLKNRHKPRLCMFSVLVGITPDANPPNFATTRLHLPDLPADRGRKPAEMTRRPAYEKKMDKRQTPFESQTLKIQCSPFYLVIDFECHATNNSIPNSCLQIVNVKLL